MLLAPLLPACAKPLPPIFDPAPSTLVWPPPPDAPRIRYVGELIGAESLKARKSGGVAFRELLAGPTRKPTFVTPNAIAVHGDRIYVSDAQAAAVFRIDLANRTFDSIQSVAGKPLECPIDVCLNDDTLAVCDSRRAAVFLMDLDGRIRSTLGLGLLKRPCAVAFNSAQSNWWVLDAAAHAIVIFDAEGRVRSFGSRGDGPGQFNFPAGLCVNERLGVIVADSMNFRVQLFDAALPATTSDPADSIGKAASSVAGLDPIRMFGRKGDAAGDFALPRDAAVDGDGHLYVLDSQFENVQIFQPDGRLLLAFGAEGRGPGQFHLPAGITIDHRDRIWVADTYNRRVQVFQYLREAAK